MLDGQVIDKRIRKVALSDTGLQVQLYILIVLYTSTNNIKKQSNSKSWPSKFAPTTLIDGGLWPLSYFILFYTRQRYRDICQFNKP